jgi:DNA-binding ferritin-like protein (Dps family)
VITALKAVEAQLAAVQTQAVTTAAAVQSAAASITATVATVQQAHTTATAALTALAASADATHQHLATRLDDLQDAVANHSNLWNKAVSELIDAVKLGVIPLQDLLKLYGDAVVGGQRVREYLDGLDLNVYQHRMQDLIASLEDGRTTIASVLDYLGSTQLLFAHQLADTIRLFQQGKVTLQRVAEIVAQIQKAFPDSQFSDLAQALEEALRKGDL